MTKPEIIRPTRERLAKGDVAWADSPDKNDRRIVLRGVPSLVDGLRARGKLEERQITAAEWLHGLARRMGLQGRLIAFYGEAVGGGRGDMCDVQAEAYRQWIEFAANTWHGDIQIIRWIILEEVTTADDLGALLCGSRDKTARAAVGVQAAQRVFDIAADWKGY